MTYQGIAEQADKAIASPWFMLAFLGIVALAAISIDVSNFTISVITAGAVILGNGSRRRFDCAVQAKLDELVASHSEARDEMLHVEDRNEGEITEMRR